MSLCAPDVQLSTTGSCFTLDQLRALVRAYDAAHPLHPLRVDATDTKQKTWDALRARLANKCAREYCWIEEPWVLAEMRPQLHAMFRPRMPREWEKDLKTWLDTTNIDAVLAAYERRFPTFKYFGAPPVDFDERAKDSGTCVSNANVCDATVPGLLRAVKSFGMVPNLDDHKGPGSHWVAIYCNLDPRRPNFGIFYYDSTARPPPPRVARFMERIASEARLAFKPKTAARFRVAHNAQRRQYGNSQCGVFALLFVIRCLHRQPFDKICSTMGDDDDMERMRNLMFRDSGRVRTPRPTHEARGDTPAARGGGPGPGSRTARPTGRRTRR
jgi:hypothetical protein